MNSGTAWTSAATTIHASCLGYWPGARFSSHCHPAEKGWQDTQTNGRTHRLDISPVYVYLKVCFYVCREIWIVVLDWGMMAGSYEACQRGWLVG